MTRLPLNRPVRIGLAGAMVMGLLVAAGVAAFNGEGPNAERVVELLDDAGVTTDAAELDEFADEFGLGGAVRILWWAEAAGDEPSEIAAEIAAMRREGMGWGQIRKALAEEHEDFDLHPGIGPVMGGHGQGHGQGQAQGQGKDKGNAPGD